jgi:hypothetical protein
LQTEMPLWFPYPDRPAPRLYEWVNQRLRNDKAISMGLTFRPLKTTMADTVRPFTENPPTTPPGWGLAPERERELLAKWRAHR